VERAVIGFLELGGLPEEALGGREVAAIGRLFGGFDDGFRLARVGHGSIEALTSSANAVKDRPYG
jgi:hypothetical protein